MSRELPILMSGPMVRALLAGTKSQFRRPMKPQPEPGQPVIRDLWALLSPIHVGDLLYCRETYWRSEPWDGDTYYKADFTEGLPVAMGVLGVGRWRPSIHMPKSAARIWLRVTAVQAQRVMEITMQDALAEGVTYPPDYPEDCTWSPGARFADLWDSIYGKTYPWESNPWVFAYAFVREER